jgi:hypothetical protein
VIEVAHEGAARQLARDLACGAAHVDVDDVGAQRLGDARALRHPALLAPGKLYDEGLEVVAGGAPQHRRALAHEVLAGNHLGHDQPRAQAMRELAERQVRHPRHGREQHTIGHGLPADLNCPGSHRSRVIDLVLPSK